jgi:preprotein translocase subunit SecD
MFCLGQLPASDQTRIKFELRRAENEPAEGLVEYALESPNHKIYLHKEAFITNKDVLNALVVIDEHTGHFNIEITFTKEGAERIAQITEQHIGKPIAVLFDNRVVTAPIVNSRVSDTAIISGQFSKAEAERIASGIKNQ